MKKTWSSWLELIFISSFPRRVFSFISRRLWRRERDALKKHITGKGPRRLIAINICYPTFIEHLRDLIAALDRNESMASVVVGPTDWPPQKYKEEHFNYLKRYGIEYGRQIFPYTAFSGREASLFIDVSINPYGFKFECPKVMYAHGLRGAKLKNDRTYFRYLGRYDAVFLTGPLHKRALLAGEKKYGFKLPAMYEVGYLRGDRISEAAGSFNRKEYLEGLGLPDAKTVTYAPSWSEFSSAAEWIDKVADTCRAMGMNLLLRLHPLMFSGRRKAYTGGVDWREKTERICATHKNVRTIINHDLDPVMLSSDALLTDASGLAIEFMSLEKPVVFLPAEKYFAACGTDKPIKWVRPDKEIADEAGLEDELDLALSGNGHKCRVEELVYNRGRALESFMQAIATAIGRKKSINEA